MRFFKSRYVLLFSGLGLILTACGSSSNTTSEDVSVSKEVSVAVEERSSSALVKPEVSSQPLESGTASAEAKPSEKASEESYPTQFTIPNDAKEVSPDQFWIPKEAIPEKEYQANGPIWAIRSTKGDESGHRFVYVYYSSAPKTPGSHPHVEMVIMNSMMEWANVSPTLRSTVGQQQVEERQEKKLPAHPPEDGKKHYGYHTASFINAGWQIGKDEAWENGWLTDMESPSWLDSVQPLPDGCKTTLDGFTYYSIRGGLYVVENATGKWVYGDFTHASMDNGSGTEAFPHEN